ncbi:MAG: tRNA 4-thiouridine(8) synthase ThiI [Clostridia bacterium]|nr:tRNA 4-thiouridine(8) synthase ThiI [Clostridia bacterium]
MKKVILLRYGEIHLKGKNRGTFENMLMENIRKSVKDFSCKIVRIAGRYLVTNFEENQLEMLIEKLTKVFGLVSLSVAFEIETNQEKIEEIAILCLKNQNILNKTFKVITSRADKTFPINSDKFSALIGEKVLNNFPSLKVDLHKPDIELFIDIRENKKTYILSEKIKCVGGMPVGSAGQGLLMLSGGIDSPVAGYMMAKRGLKINAIHFHSFPYTSVQAKEKVIKLAEILTDFTGGIKLFVVPFTKIQEQIHIKCNENYMISIMRRIMIRIAEKICEKNNFKTIITGESLGQVASQTIESITVTNSVLKTVPMMRPLIAFDKTDIIEIAQKIGTFETSILPYEDCCTVFLPKSPIIKPTIKNAEKQESFLDIEELVNEAVENTEILRV